MEVEGVPVAPLDVRCHDANKDYVVVTWKQPAVEGSSQILGYYIDRFMLPQRVVRMAVLHIRCHPLCTSWPSPLLAKPSSLQS